MELVGIDDVFLVGPVVRVRARERVLVGVARAQTCVALVSFRWKNTPGGGDGGGGDGGGGEGGGEGGGGDGGARSQMQMCPSRSHMDASLMSRCCTLLTVGLKMQMPVVGSLLTCWNWTLG